MKKFIFLDLLFFIYICVFAESFQVPFVNLPKTSEDKNVEFVKVLDKKYNTLQDGRTYIDYIIFVSKNNIKDLFVENIFNNNYVFYVNDNNLGRLSNQKERNDVIFSVTKDIDGNFIMVLKNLSNKVFRLDIDVSVVFKGIKLTTILELMDYEAFPSKPVNESSFFDKKDFSIGKMIIIE